MAGIIVVGYDNGSPIVSKKSLIDLARVNDHSVTALLSLHIQQFTYLYKLAPMRYAFKVTVFNTLLDRMNINGVNIHIISVF